MGRAGSRGYVEATSRLRLPNDASLTGYEALAGVKTMEVEVASMKFLAAKSSIPVPKVFAYDTSVQNQVGAPYILIEYIHGSTVASKLREAKSCAPQMFGTPEQDCKFREQMAHIQATLASFQFPQIGSLYHNEETGSFYLGSEPQTGKGPWTSSAAYYDDLVSHLLKSAAAHDDLRQSQSFMVAAILNQLIRIHGGETAGPFRLTNRDFGAHNILVNDDFDIVGVIDLDGVMAAPLEVVAQYPTLTFLEGRASGGRRNAARGYRADQTHGAATARVQGAVGEIRVFCYPRQSASDGRQSLGVDAGAHLPRDASLRAASEICEREVDEIVLTHAPAVC
ncbi:hypothetical protein VTK26DRAFT_4210 [Humicola hyalothermophila]